MKNAECHDGGTDRIGFGKSVVLGQNRDQGRSNKELKTAGDSTYGVKKDVAKEG